jgi:pyruvate dehydrogenase E1 component alpha subunit
MVRKIKEAKDSSNKQISKEDLLKSYRNMVLIRRFEERAGQAYGMGLIGGFCHLYIGQEAIITGMKAALKEGDAYITSYRDHGHILSCGTEPKHVMAELFGRETGVSRGKGGSMHLFDTKKHFYGGHGIVGAQFPIGAGVGFAYKYQGSDNLAVTFCGDGAANQGQVYETFNMASLWKLPTLFVIEDNKYGMGTSVARSSAGEYHKRGEAFDIPGERVNGQDFFAVREATAKAAKHIRAGKGPYLLVMDTYRYRGHSMSDPGNYRSKDEINDYKENHDPINNFKKFGLDNKIVKEDELKEIDGEIKKIVAEAIEFAKESPEPIASELWTDILR